ncbi:MAG: alpha/beta fold hydrolase [Pseudomonadota bacterium]
MLKSLGKRLKTQTLATNQRLVQTANNAYDRLFRSEQLIKSAQTPFEVIHSDGLMSVRAYAPLAEDAVELEDGGALEVERRTHATPLVIVPPLAASPLIFDLLPQRSLVRYFLARGYRVYMIDWGEPGREHTHLGIKDYASEMMGEALGAVRRHSDEEELSLMGWCMGGLFCLMYAGLAHDERIRNIVTIASPVDSQQGGVGGRVIRGLVAPAHMIRKYTRFRLNKVNPERLQVPGWFNALAFKLTNPVGSVTTYWDLLVNLWDREFVESHTTTSDFLNNMLDYPGGIIQDFVIKYGINNDLSRGEIKIGDTVSRFEHIRCPVLAFAGSSDALVTPEAAQRGLELVASEDKQFVIAPGGHAGVVMGNKAQHDVWAVAAEWLARRSD